MPWGAVAVHVAASAYSANQSKKAARTAASAEERAIQEQGRQFDVTQEQYAPFQEAGLRGLEQYESMLGQYGDFDIPSNIPDTFSSRTSVPELYDFQSRQIPGFQGNVPQGFEFGQEDFDQYKSPGYEFNAEEELQALDRKLASRGKRKSGLRVRALTEMGQDLASDEFQAARGRAYQDYTADVTREGDVYGRNVDQFNRDITREQDLFGRVRDQYSDQAQREGMLYDRDYRDYASEVAREDATHGRALEDYGRLYLDPMSRHAQLSGRGQATTTGLAALRDSYAQNVGQSARNIGDLNAASKLAQGNAYASGIGALGNMYGRYKYNQTYTGSPYGQQVRGDAYMPAAPYNAGEY